MTCFVRRTEGSRQEAKAMARDGVRTVHHAVCCAVQCRKGLNCVEVLMADQVVVIAQQVLPPQVLGESEAAIAIEVLDEEDGRRAVVEMARLPAHARMVERRKLLLLAVLVGKAPN